MGDEAIGRWGDKAMRRWGDKAIGGIVLRECCQARECEKPYEKPSVHVLSPIPRERSTNACSRSSDLLLVCSAFPACQLIVDNWQLASDLDMEQTILQITAAGLCQNLTGFPKTECGCKGTTKNAHTQAKRALFVRQIIDLSISNGIHHSFKLA